MALRTGPISSVEKGDGDCLTWPTCGRAPVAGKRTCSIEFILLLNVAVNAVFLDVHDPSPLLQLTYDSEQAIRKWRNAHCQQC
jgi:hypothetical protein